MAKKKQILYPVVFMLVLTAVYTFVLAFINESSAEIIARQEEVRIQRSILYTVGLIDAPDADVDDTQIQTLFDDTIERVEDETRTYYRYFKEDEAAGYVFPFTGNGLWGSISGYIAFSPDIDHILGIDFTAHSETPGLGGRIDELWFKEQFRELNVTGDTPVVFSPAAGSNIDGITGATLTSNSVSVIVNRIIADTKTLAQEVTL